MDLTTFIFSLLLAWLFYKILMHILKNRFIAREEKMRMVLQYLDEIIHDVEVEKIGDIEYWYDKDDKEFLGQGKSIDDIIDVLKIRFPSHIFLIPDKGAISVQTGWKLITRNNIIQ